MSAPLRLRLFIDNRAGRKGVPIRRSFEDWVRAALKGRHSGTTEINIALLEAATARAVNRQYRSKDYATNVLSFPYEPLPGEKSALLGDLALCPAVIAREAKLQRKRLRDHYAHLTVHGVLHLLGHDHETSAGAAKMEAIEKRVLAGFGIADPYSPP
ncbi:MAG TPA: rRNA maturation RNase YbeY [Rhodanobacteraceae bacterium]|jgi:probable rRNA maturation factor|nr:rRNA maturation RNase YbeY [Rhodanobacteraceae bacterium]